MSYHSLKPLVSFFKKFKLEIFDFELISAQGGSIRIFVANENQRKVKTRKINNQIKKENLQKIYEIKTYQNFYRDIQYQKNTLRKLINELNSKKKTIIGYGAPAKLTTLSHVLDFNYKDFKIVIDNNNLKQNSVTVFTLLYQLRPRKNLSNFLPSVRIKWLPTASRRA